jgi:queuine tRNA-ribosyltransferase
VIETPVFVVAGVSSLVPRDLSGVGAHVLFLSAYPFCFYPGHSVVEEVGGLHRFVGWSRMLITDSGTSEIYRHSAKHSVSEEGVTFRSPIDGTERHLTPEEAVKTQETLGGDIIMCLDGHPAFPASFAEACEALERTTRWARRCVEAKRRNDQALFGVLPLWEYAPLRKRAAETLSACGLDGIVFRKGRPDDRGGRGWEEARETCAVLPYRMPRFVVGADTLESVVEWVKVGADLCASVSPFRLAREGRLVTYAGEVSLENPEFAGCERPVQEACICYTCRHYSLGYLYHLFQSHEILVTRLASIHNLHTYLRLVDEAREAIRQKRFSSFCDEFYSRRSGGRYGQD